MPNHSLYKICLALFSLVVISCSGPMPSLPAQSWNGIEIQVESRPPQLVSGMNEFIIITTVEQHMPANNLIVSVRINEEGRWYQAIQDGHVGAYRRALLVKDPQQDILFVQIEYDNRQGILMFPLKEQKIRPDK